MAPSAAFTVLLVLVVVVQFPAVGGARSLLAGWVEITDACVRACGVDRAMLGLPVASAVAEDRRSFRALCSSACRDGCPNVVDLYATVAAAEGMSVPVLCEAQNQNKAGNRRMMMGTMPPAPVGALAASAPTSLAPLGALAAGAPTSQAPLGALLAPFGALTSPGPLGALAAGAPMSPTPLMIL